MKFLRLESDRAVLYTVNMVLAKARFTVNEHMPETQFHPSFRRVWSLTPNHRDRAFTNLAQIVLQSTNSVKAFKETMARVELEWDTTNMEHG